MSVIYSKKITGPKDGPQGRYETAEAVVDFATEGAIPENIKKDAVVFGVTGTYVPTDANLKPENIKNGVTIFGVTGTYTGQ